MEKNEVKEELESKNIKEIERQIERYSPVIVEPIKTKKDLKEKMLAIDCSKMLIKRLPKALDEFVFLYKNKFDIKFNVLIVSNQEGYKIAEFINGYLFSKGIVENTLLTEFDYSSKIKSVNKFVSFVVYKSKSSLRELEHAYMQEKNVFTVGVVSPDIYYDLSNLFVDNFSFILFDKYQPKEDVEILEKHVKTYDFKFESKSSIKDIQHRFQDVRATKNLLSSFIIDKKIDRSGNIISYDEFKKWFDNREFPEYRSDEKEEVEVEFSENEMKNIIGLESVKKQVDRIAKMLEKNKDDRPMLHMAFLGNPGTGKTSIARVIANEFYARKIIKENKLLEVSRVDLVGSYIGHTAEKTANVIKKAMGGVLFIDEAYSLATSKSDKDFGPEALATLVKEMEDKRDDIVVIFAGYEKEMREMISVNKGLESRIAFKIKFEDYSVVELMQILKFMISKTKYTIEKDCLEIIEDYFKSQKEKENFSNGRFVRNFFEKLKLIQAERSTGFEITKEDVLIAIEEEPESKDSKRKFGFAI